MHERAGHYQTQLTGYKAFIPQKLPPRPAVLIGDKLKNLLTLSEQRFMELNGIGSALPNLDLFVMMAVRKEALAVLKNSIEKT